MGAKDMGRTLSHHRGTAAREGEAQRAARAIARSVVKDTERERERRAGSRGEERRDGEGGGGRTCAKAK